MELTIDGDALRTVLKDSRFGRKLGKVNIRHETVDFSFDGEDLSIFIIGVESRIPAIGSWAGSVQLPLEYWGVLQKVPPSAEALVVRYDNLSSKLFFGTAGFKAEWQEQALVHVSTPPDLSGSRLQNETVRTDLLKPLNDLAYCCECAAQDYTGELKSELSDLCQLIRGQVSGYEALEIQAALPRLEGALDNYRSRQKEQGAMILAGVSRDWWAVVLPKKEANNI
jgi:hypothetical protein